MSLVLHEQISDQLGKITLNDPDHLNAMSEAMAAEFRTLVQELAERKRPYRALIVTGAGRAFSAGGDLDMLEIKAKKTIKQNEEEMLSFYRSFLDIRKLKTPLVAAVNGHAVGAGLCLACACDFRVVSQTAKLGFTFTKLGLYPGMGATYLLPRVIGKGRAKELMLTGRIVEGSDLETFQIASRVVSPDNVQKEAESLATELLQCGPTVTRDLLFHLRGEESELEEALQHEAKEQAASYARKEFLEGIRAAKEKRSPVWE